MSAPRVVAVAPGSPAARAGVEVGDEVLAVDGEAPRDIIRWTWLTEDADPVLDVRRGGLEREVVVTKAAGEPLGVDVHSALFDQLRTCDNHCEFCFIYQLPPGLRRSLYLKDDDYRLSFLYGNFTTLTRFTEADLERVVTEGLGPLNVSIHATDPDVRTDMLRNRRGGPALRWLRALLDHGVEIHGQVVCCPGLNDGNVLEATLAGIVDRFPELASVCVVPLGVSRFNREPRMRVATAAEAARVVATISDWQAIALRLLGRRLVFAADELYLLAGLPFPEPGCYEGFPMHEDGVGMVRTFELELTDAVTTATGVQPGFFAWADATSAGPGASAAGAAPANRPGRYEAAGDLGAPLEGYRSVRTAEPERAGFAASADRVRLERAPGDGSGSSRTSGPSGPSGPSGTTSDSTAPSSGLAPAVALAPPTSRRRARPLPPGPEAPTAVLTGEYGARVLAPMLEQIGRGDVRVIPVENRFFGGNVAVAGLLVGEDLARVLAVEPPGHRYLLPDVCLSGGRFLDGSAPGDLPRPVEVVPTDGHALRRALERS